MKPSSGVLECACGTRRWSLRRLLGVVERLGPDARRAWREASVRDFNVGLQAGRAPHSSGYAIAPATLDRLAALGGRLVVTVYAPFPRPRGGRTA